MTQKQGFQYQRQPIPTGEPMFDYWRGSNEPWDDVKQRALGEAQASLRDAKAKENFDLARGWQVVHDRLLARTEADALAATTRSPGSSITGFSARAWQDTDPAEHKVFVHRTPQNEPFWEAFYKINVADRPECLQQIGRSGPGGATVDRTTQISEAQAYAALDWAWQQPGWNDDEPPLVVRKVFKPTAPLPKRRALTPSSETFAGPFLGVQSPPLGGTSIKTGLKTLFRRLWWTLCVCKLERRAEKSTMSKQIVETGKIGVQLVVAGAGVAATISGGTAAAASVATVIVATGGAAAIGFVGLGIYKWLSKLRTPLRSFFDEAETKRRAGPG